MRRLRAGVVVEQTLGHVTHGHNLREAMSARSDLEPVWLSVAFEVDGVAARLPVYRSNWSVRASLRARRAVQKARRAAEIDALLFHTQVSSLFSVDLMHRIPTIVSLDATPINYDSIGAAYNHRAAGNGPLDRLKYALNRRAFHAAAGLVTWSQWAKRSLVDDYGVPTERVRVLAPGAHAGFFEIGARRLARSDRDSSRRLPRILFVGGDFERKGGALLLDLMRGPLAGRCELHVVTQTPIAPRPNVFVYRGVAPNSPGLLRLFEEADVFALPTSADCLAMVLMEAAAAGLPTITTTVGGLSESIVPGESGCLVSPGDGRALGQALDALIQDPDLRRRMAVMGHRRARHKFDSARNNAALLDYLLEVAHSPRAARVRVGTSRPKVLEGHSQS